MGNSGSLPKFAELSYRIFRSRKSIRPKPDRKKEAP